MILPDTQRYAESYPYIFTSQTRWIADHKEQKNIAFVLHEGDITDDNNDVQWQNAVMSMNILDGVVPYALALGNHDGSDVRYTAPFNTHFPVSRYEDLATFGGVYEPGKLDNSFHLFSAGGTNWLVVALEWAPGPAVLDWANRVVAAHPNRRVMVVTHTYLYSDDTLHGSNHSHQWVWGSNAVVMWNNFIRRHSNISFVFSGHVLNDGTGRLVSIGDHGNRVYQMLANYQMLPNGGSGFLRLVKFDPDQNTVSVTTYTPYIDAFKTDPENEFVFENVYFGPPDTTPPTTPSNLNVTAITESQMDLIWDAASDPESGVSHYTIYRDGVQVGTSDTTVFSDVGLIETSTYTYEVFAVNGDGLEGTKNASFVDPTVADTIPPAIKDVRTVDDPTKVVVVFSKPIDRLSAEKPVNYIIDNDVSVVGASLAADLETVALTTSPLSEGITYTLTVNNVTNDTMTHDAIAPNSQASFTFLPALFTDDFDDGDMVGWTVVNEGVIEGPSNWSVLSGEVIQSGNVYGPDRGATSRRRGTFAYWNEPMALVWTNYTYEVTLNSSDNDGIGIMFRYQDPKNYYKVDLDNQRNFRTLFKVKTGIETTLAAATGGYTQNADMVLSVTLVDSVITVTLDGIDVFGGPITDSDITNGTVALYSWGNTGARFDDVAVLYAGA